MSTIKVAIFFVDGGFHEYAESADFLARFRLLQSQGLTGKILVHELISDDWAAPPRIVEIVHEDLNGVNVKAQIQYA